MRRVARKAPALARLVRTPQPCRLRPLWPRPRKSYVLAGPLVGQRLGIAFQEEILLPLGGRNPLGQGSAGVAGHAGFSLEKVSNRLGRDTALHPSQTRQQQVHLVAKTSGTSAILGCRLNDFDLAIAALEQSP